MKWPCRREIPRAEERGLGRRLRGAVDQAMDDAGIKPGGFTEDEEAPEKGTEEK